MQGRDRISRGPGSDPVSGIGVRGRRARARLRPAGAGDLRDGCAHSVHRASKGASRPSAARRRRGHRVTQTSLAGVFLTMTDSTISSNGGSRYQSDKVRVAIIGVGNCASSLVQGVEYYKDADANESVPGLMHVDLGGYNISDIGF